MPEKQFKETEKILIDKRNIVIMEIDALMSFLYITQNYLGKLVAFYKKIALDVIF